MIRFGRPFTGEELKEIQAFLSKGGLVYDNDIEYTVAIRGDDRQLIATGSLAGNVLKCIYVSPEYQGEGYSSQVVQNLINEAFKTNHSHLFLFTKPEYESRYRVLGFYTITRTERIVLMENRRTGIADFLNLQEAPAGEKIGAVVCNCDPFTKGHRYLVETAANQCDWIHVFVLSEDRSKFPKDVRFQLVKEGVADLTNVLVHPTSDYLISYVTFPNYFLRENAVQANCELDLKIFRDWFVKYFAITHRFIGEEPFSSLTRDYNRQMKEFFSGTELTIAEIPRLKANGEFISATKVRELLHEGNLTQAVELVPASTAAYLKQHW